MTQTVFQTPTTYPVIDYAPTKQYPSFSAQVNQKITVTTLTATTGVTVTAAQILGGLLLHPAGGAINDTTDTAANIVNAIEGADIGSAILFTLRNTTGGGNTITVVGGTGVTISGTATIAQNNQKSFLFVVTAIGASPTVTAYSMGTVTF